jgi:ribulose-phosphate 3-epimerase
MSHILVAPSILSADFLKLGDELKAIKSAGADFVHFDVMDGHFVPNISFGIPVLKSIGHHFEMLNDVHIMISDPKFYAPKFIAAGADYVTFHLEATNSIKECVEIIATIHDLGAKAGMSIRPGTDIHKLDDLLPLLDLVLVMSVEPGFGGQAFLVSALDKIKYLKDYRSLHDNAHFLIEVDGGINDITGARCVDAGADILVAGSYIFGHPDYKERIGKLKRNG